jgi:hypothetical protein
MNVLALGNWCAPWVRRCFHSVKSLETSESGLLFGGPVSCCELPDRLFYFDVCRMFYTKCLRFVLLTFAGVLFDEAIAVVEPVYHQEDIAYDI